MHDDELSALAMAYQAGDPAGLERLVGSLTRPLIAVAYRYTRDWEWARDLTQETWIKVHEQIDRYDPAKPFRAWLFTIHRNGCLSHLRRAWVRYELGSQGSRREDDTALPARSRSNPEDDFERQEFHEHLLMALGVLSESQRRVFTQVDIEGRDQQEVARELGIQYSTLRTTLHFARRRMAERLIEMEKSR